MSVPYFLTIYHLFIIIILLYNIVLVLPYVNMNPSREVSQREKHQYSILTQKDGNDNPVCKTAKETDV